MNRRDTGRKWKKRNQRSYDDIEIIVKDGFTRKRINRTTGRFNETVRKTLADLDEKYNLAWDKILPKRFYDRYVERKRRSRERGREKEELQ